MPLFDFALFKVLFIAAIGADFLAPRMILAFESLLKEMLHYVLVWLMIVIRTAIARTSLFIFLCFNAVFANERCTPRCCAF